MKRKKFPVIPVVLVALLFGGVVYAKMSDYTPKVGTFEELQEMQMEREKKKQEAVMAKATENPLGTGRTSPSAKEVVANVEQVRNLNDVKRRLVKKYATALIWNTAPKPTKDVVNDAATYNSWFREESGRKGK